MNWTFSSGRSGSVSLCFNPLCTSQELCAYKLCIADTMVMISNPERDQPFRPGRSASPERGAFSPVHSTGGQLCLRSASTLLSVCFHLFSWGLGDKFLLGEEVWVFWGFFLQNSVHTVICTVRSWCLRGVPVVVPIAAEVEMMQITTKIIITNSLWEKQKKYDVTFQVPHNSSVSEPWK